jgi:outer membrane protein
MSSRYLIPLAVAAALAAPVAANAWDLDAYPGQPKGDWIFRLGWTDVNPANENLPIKNDQGQTFGYLVADQGTNLSGTITYMITDHIGTELLVAVPFTHGLDLKIGSGPQRIGYVDELPPTLSLQWHFNPDGVIRPYVGVGMNWALFSGEHLRKNTVYDLTGISNAKLKMGDSFGGAAQFGIDWRLSDHWLLNTDIRYLGITSKATITGDDGLGGTVKVNLGDADINPLVYTAAVGYQWGAPKPPVAAAAPPPPPPPPPPPATARQVRRPGQRRRLRRRRQVP